MAYKMRVTDKQPNNKKKIILSVIIVILILIIGLAIYWSLTNKSSLSQVKDLDKAIKNNDYKTVSNMLKIEGDNINETEAKHLTEYINQNQNRPRYNKEITQIKRNIKNNKQSDSEIGRLTDKQGKPIITISQNGVDAFIFRKVSFQPHYRNIYIKSMNDKVTYGFQYKNKEDKAVITSDNAKLGRFIVGDYDIPATKEFEESEVGLATSIDGQLHINTDKVNKDGRIYADDNFSQAWFKVSLKNNSSLDKDFKLLIDDKEIDYNKKKVYGKLPASTPLDVKAKGRLNNKSLYTNEVQVKENTQSKPQTITLKFDKKEINKQLNKKKKTEKEAKSFIKDYTEQLNKGYESSDFSRLKSYFEDDKSDVATNIKQQVESKKRTHFKDLNIESSNFKDDEVTVIINKKNEKKQRIRSQYDLIYNEDKDEFKIREYKDI